MGKVLSSKCLVEEAKRGPLSGLRHEVAVHQQVLSWCSTFQNIFSVLFSGFDVLTPGTSDMAKCPWLDLSMPIT